MASHASAPEAGYSRTQVQNIVRTVGPEQELLDAQMELAFARLEDQVSPDAEPIPVAPLASERAEWTEADLRPFEASTTWSEPLERQHEQDPCKARAACEGWDRAQRDSEGLIELLR